MRPPSTRSRPTRIAAAPAAPLAAAALAILAAPAANAQELVPNGSFEQATGCPVTNGQIALAAPWISPTTGTTDYFNPCDPSPDNVSVPTNAVGMQDAYEGSSYGGFILLSPPMGAPNYREYLQTPLVSALEAGKTYRYSMQVSLAEDSSAATDRIGAYLSATPISAADWNPLPVVPQLETPESVYLTSTIEWMSFSDTLVAAGGEQYLTIGNFHDAVASNVVPAGFGPAPPLQVGTGYYYVDVVSLACEPCLEPPADLTAWWRLDETSGALAVDSVGAFDGVHVDAPVPTAGQVDGALAFLGNGVSVPSAAPLELGTDDFTFDLWVRPDALAGPQTLLAKMPSGGGPGVGLVLNADGTVTFTMVDAALNAAGATTTAALAAGEWSLVAIAVDRSSPTGGRLHVGDALATLFDPTPAAGSLASAAPLRFAQDGGAGLGADLAGTLDEVELFHRALHPNEVRALHQARTSGKCKVEVVLPPITVTGVPVGGLPVITTSTGTIWNGGGLTGTFGVAVRGDAAGTRYGGRRSDVAGPQDPLVLTPQPVQLGPGQSAPLRLELDLPREPVWQLACYTVTVIHLETGATYSARSALVRPVEEATRLPK